MNEMKKCSKCGIEKPLFAFYRKKHKKIDAYCIKCKGIDAAVAKSLQEGDVEPLMRLNNVSTFSYYHVLLLDASFNEYNATINARTHLKLNDSFFDLKGFEVGGERVFWEVAITPMSKDEYYAVHNSLSSEGREYHCPNLRVAKRMGRKEMTGVLGEFMGAVYGYWESQKELKGLEGGKKGVSLTKIKTKR